MPGEITDNLQKLLDTTLGSFLDLVQCDAGSVFTVRKNAQGEQMLAFEAMVTRSLNLRGVPESLSNLQFRIDDSTIVGRTALYKKPILLNLAATRAGVSPCVEKILNYQTRNIFSGPLVTPRGDLVGVVQLLNKLPNDGSMFDPEGTSPLPDFDQKDERLFSIIVGQAALAIENSLLLEEQERLLEGFVNASVTAIEARDPVTCGHSMRVARYTVGLAEAVNRTQTGRLKDVTFTPDQLRELRFAAMLHDVGKIGIKEEILQKRKKLFPQELEVISMRFKLMRTQMKFLQETEQKDYRDAIRRLEHAWKYVIEANEPSVMRTATGGLIRDLSSITVPFDSGEVLFALTEMETEKLSLAQGSLTESERLEIETHVSKTFEILRMIPWSRGLERVPEIAHKHHEKLDGSGYPKQLAYEDIPPQARMLSICDIYDALIAEDRPYKSAMPASKALDIIEAQVKAGNLDGAYFEVFVQANLYDHFKSPTGNSDAAA